MKHTGKHRVRWLALSGGVALATITAAMGLSASANATARPVPRPHSASEAGTPPPVAVHAVKAFAQEFTSNTDYFCPTTTGNAPCNGDPTVTPNTNLSSYGTIDRVHAGFSNGGYGNYAPSTNAMHGHWMALVSGDEDGNQGNGCPEPTVTEFCTGPYALFGTGTSAGAENVFPHNGFTVTDDLYLSPSTAPKAGSLVDDDVELNNQTGTYGIDNVITACAKTGGFAINFGNGSPGTCTGAPVVTTDGWYRFVFDFSNTSGKAYITRSVLKETTLTTVKTSGPLPVGGTAKPIGTWGGPGYFWLPTEDISGLPLANFALQLGQHANGYTP